MLDIELSALSGEELLRVYDVNTFALLYQLLGHLLITVKKQSSPVKSLKVP